MIGGEAASRILEEVMKGVFVSSSDTPEQRTYREQIKIEIEEIEAKGGIVDMPKEWL